MEFGSDTSVIEGELLTLLSLVEDNLLTIPEAAKRVGLLEEEFCTLLKGRK